MVLYIMSKSLTRQELLQETFEYFIQMAQWMVSSPHHESQCYSKAEAIIRVLEVIDCQHIREFQEAHAKDLDRKRKISRTPLANITN